MPEQLEVGSREWWQERRRETILMAGHYRRVPCPKCGAQIGEDCHSPAWHVGNFHAARRKLADMTPEERAAWERESWG
jgi:hypothetical protein